MSHFKVAVISKSPDQVKTLLAPYQENNGEDCPREFLEFFEVEGEYLEKYQNETATMVKTPDGHLISPRDEELRVPGTFGYGKDTHMLPDGYENVEVKLSHLYQMRRKAPPFRAGDIRRLPRKEV
ncbi:hypothetical protein [Thermicanus aegyptius]|uniref:hypothetical protein n=1 Tax=Thermicanus aegyptius TaxID=94009 RepID=UPI0004096619|nr:hypothetical protein [Thermicanus aegyptius]